MPLTIHGKEAVFIHLYLPLSGGDGTPAGYYRVRASLYDSEGNRDDIWMSDPLYLHPYDDTPPLPHPPSISLHGTGQPLMVHGNSSLELAVTVYAGVPDSFAWDLNGDGETDVITPAGFLVHTFGEPGTYHVSVTAADAWNRTDTAGVVVRVNALPVFTDGYGSLPVRMNPGPVDIRLNVTDPDGEILWYAWTLDGEPVWSGSDPSRQLAGVTIGIPGNHTLTLTVTDSDGGTASRSITVRVNAPPRITDITLERIPGHPLMDTVWVRFTAEARDDHGEIVAYHWDPDGSERYHITTRENTLMALVEPGILHWGVTVVDDLGLGTVRRAAEDITMDPGIFLMTLDGVIIEGDTMIWPGDGPLSLVVVARGSFPPGADGLELTVSFDGTIIHRELVRRPQPGTGGQGVIREDMVVTVDGPPRDGVLDIGMLGSETDVRRELNVTGDRGRTGDGSPGPGGSVPHLTAVWFVAACAGGLVLRRHSRRRMVHDRGR